jgi:hypothetical protein
MEMETDLFYPLFQGVHISPINLPWERYLQITVMKTKTKILLYLSILAFVDMIIPIPFTALMLIYVIFEKPAWFKNSVTEIYNS